MNGTITTLQHGGRPLSIYLPNVPDKALPVAYMLAGPDPALELTGAAAGVDAAVARGDCRPFVAVAVGSGSWNTDYTPWPAPPLMAGEPPFTGGAPATLQWLADGLIPFIEEKLPVKTGFENRAVVGYSLAGLAALYAMYVSGAFGACGCCSGSLWYDGWGEFMAANRPRPGARIYLSLGKKEEKSRNARMAAVGDATRAANERLSHDENVAETTLHWHEGGHFSSVPDRVAMAMIWLNR